MNNIIRFSLGNGLNPTYKELVKEINNFLIEKESCFIELKLNTLNIGVDEI